MIAAFALAQDIIVGSLALVGYGYISLAVSLLIAAYVIAGRH